MIITCQTAGLPRICEKNILEFKVSECWKTMINQSWQAKRSQENFEKTAF